MSQEIDNLLYIEEISLEQCIETLRRRFVGRKIYTQLGAVLLSINPYQYFEGSDNIYDFSNTDRVHLYRTLDRLYENLLSCNSDKNLANNKQIIIVSGESGSGKTETTKQIVHYLNHRVKGDSLLDKIEASGLVLEIFGNAPTHKNHNSSRFGKFIEVFYDNDLKCLGMKTSVYLLEKTRVLNLEDFGRFHIFTRSRDSVLETLQKAGFLAEDIQFIFRIVDLILETLKMNYGQTDNPILKKTLITKTTNYQGEQITKEYSPEEFQEIRGIFAMKLYDTLFQWIVEKMNILYSISQVDANNLKTIGILDIFGFEDLSENSLEQLSINYANEIIQGLLNGMLIEEKIELYKSEGIPLENIQITLNKEQIELVEQLFIALDEECMLPRGSSKGFIEKIILRFSDNPNFKTNKLTKNQQFQIQHYAGSINYQVEDFCKKNIDRNYNEIDDILTELFYQQKIGWGNTPSRKRKMVGKLKINSITNQFRNQLGDFITSIQEADLFFIKCIKPNSLEQPMTFENELVRDQLRYNGILQLIHILRQGYSYHFHIESFLRDYREFIPDSRDSQEIYFGRTRVFLTENCYEQIRRQYLQRRIDSIMTIQRICRTKVQECHYLDIMNASRLIENRIWANYIHKDYIYHRSAYRIQRFFHKIVYRAQRDRHDKALRIIRFLRGIVFKRKYLMVRQKVCSIQSRIRSRVARNRLIVWKMGAIIIQTWWKSYLRKKNDLRKQNIYLENELKNKDKMINKLEKRIIELEQKLSRANYIDKTIITERDHYIIELKRDIDSYQNNIRERLEEKMRLTDTIDKLHIENNLLIRQLGILRRQQSTSWLSKWFGFEHSY